MKKALIVIGIILIVVVIGLIVAFFAVNSVYSKNTETVHVTIEEGEDMDVIAQKLKGENLIISPLAFKAYLLLYGKYSGIYPGKYEFDKTNTKEIVDKITSGPEDEEKQVTIVEGWTNADIAAYLAEEGLVDEADFLAAAGTTDSRQIIPDKTYEFLKGKPADYGLEGFLFPDTYRFFTNTTSAEIIEKMLDNFKIKYTDTMQKKAEEAGLSTWEVVTLASIVEKEVSQAEDRRIVAGIFLSRLSIDKPLQSDATVNYITGKDTTIPSLEDISADSLYNTYLNPGLPPAPICNPSQEAISAVLNPAKTEYLYFLTTPDGEAVFSKTYEEHLANRDKYYSEDNNQ